MNLLQIVHKLIGPIDPVGDSNIDRKRFENLKKFCELTDAMVMMIDDVSVGNKDRQESSMKEAGDYANNFLSDTLGIEE